MIKDLTLKPTTYKAVRIGDGVYPELREMFGDNLCTLEEDFSLNASVAVIIQGERINVPTTHVIIVAEYADGNLSGVYATNSTEDLSMMFNWEGEI